MGKKMNSLFQFLASLCVYFIVLSSIYPPIRILPGHEFISFIAMLGWIICAFIIHPAFFTIFSKKPLFRMLIIFFITYTFLFPYLFGNGVIGNRYLQYAQVPLFFMIYQFNKTYGYQKNSLSIIKWSIPFIIITSIITLYNLMNNPYASRSAFGSDAEAYQLNAQGIGGYEFIYFLTFITLIIGFFIINRRNLKIDYKLQILLIFIFILFLLTIVYSNFFTALGLIIISSLVMIFFKKSNIFYKMICLLAGILLLIQWKPIFLGITNFMIKHLEGRTANAIISLQNNVLYGSGESLFSERGPMFKASLESFLEYPVFGKVVSNIYYSGGYLTGFGQHSQILDTFSLYGFLIGIINVCIITYPFLVRFIKNRMLFSLNLAMMMSTLILFTLNNATPSIGYAVFFIYPIIYDWIVGRFNKNEQVSNNESEIIAS